MAGIHCNEDVTHTGVLVRVLVIVISWTPLSLGRGSVFTEISYSQLHQGFGAYTKFTVQKQFTQGTGVVSGNSAVNVNCSSNARSDSARKPTQLNLICQKQVLFRRNLLFLKYNKFIIAIEDKFYQISASMAPIAAQCTIEE